MEVTGRYGTSLEARSDLVKRPTPRASARSSAKEEPSYARSYPNGLEDCARITGIIREAFYR